MFENIIGHHKQVDTLKDMLKNDNVSHAYLFSGTSGIGKKQVALEFARQILKVENLNSSPDFKLISKSEEKKDIIVEQIRKEIIDDVYVAPASSSKKVYIIDDAEKLNIAAQNTLLKTLEEPPKYVVIILVATSVSSFLTTILSRVTQISFQNIDEAQFKSYLLNNLGYNLGENIIDFLDGSIGKAVELESNERLEKLNELDEIFKYLLEKDVINSLIKFSAINFNESIYLEYLEHLLYKNGKYFCVKFVEKARIRLKNNGNYDIVIDNMILNIIDNI